MLLCNDGKAESLGFVEVSNQRICTCERSSSDK